MTRPRRLYSTGTLIGAIFLMATSAVGPGFLTQTALFTSQLGASFAFAILVSIVIDVGAQLNIWRVITVAGRRTQDLGNAVFSGLGTFISAVVALGGFAFNIGNIAGCGLGLNVLFGVDIRVGATLSAALAIGLFALRHARAAMDRFTVLLGFVMISLTLYVAATAGPPLSEAALRAVYPSTVDVLAIITLVGGTVGGYITFAGAHRLLAAGIQGPDHADQVSRAASTGILVTGLMRVLLFLAALGGITGGGVIASANPPASVFQNAAGNFGYRIFGLVMWAAAVTSVVGASYTSTSFLKTLHPVLSRERSVIIAFITGSAILFTLIGRPVKTLVVVGALNAFVLPVALITLLVAAMRPDIVGAYRHPRWLALYGAAVALIMTGLALYTVYTVV